MVQLCPHRSRTTERPAQRRLVEDGPQAGRVRTRKYCLASNPQADPAADLLGVRVLKHDDRAGIILGLQQSGHELSLIGADLDSGLLKAEVLLEPARQHV